MKNILVQLKMVEFLCKRFFKTPYSTMNDSNARIFYIHS